MSLPRQILIADPDPATARVLGPALRRRGFRLHVARDGSRALKLAILRAPDLVLMDEQAAFVDGRAFVSILRANPRTELVPVVFTGYREDQERGRLGQYLRKPLDLDEVLARIDQVFRRLDAARAASSDATFHGSLAQIPLVDLLQVLAMNRKAGRLELARDGVRAEIALLEGRVTDAAAGLARGEKALYRLLSWREGQFAFVAGRAAGTGTGRIEKRLDELVLEGFRQADEVARLLPSLPAADERLALAVAPAAVPEGLHPVTAEVVSLLARPRSLQDVLDGAAATDLEVLRALAAMLECGYARREPRPAGEARSLLAGQALHALRRRIERGAGRGACARGKVILAGGGPLARRSALVRFATLPGFTAEADGAPVAFGTLGRFTMGDDVCVDLVALPSDPAHAPLWRPFSTGAVGALVLLPAEGIVVHLAALARELRFPVGVCGPPETSVEPALGSVSAGCSFLGGDPAEALRALLAIACEAAPSGR